MEDIKRRINIEGEKVINVGYRSFLLEKAIKLELSGFDAENIKENGKERLVVSVDGEHKNVLTFIEYAKNNFPSILKELAIKEPKVYDVEQEPEKVLNIDIYRNSFNVEQQTKIIQGGLLLRNSLIEKFDKLDDKYDKVSKNLESINENMMPLTSIDKTLKELFKALTHQEEKDKI